MHYTKELSCALLLTLFITGCSKASKENELLTSVSLHDVMENALTSNFFIQSKEREESWWTIFGGKELSILMERAIQNSPTLQKAEARVVAAQASVKMVRSNLFPNLSASATENWSYLSRYGFDRDFFPTIPGAPPIPSKLNEIDLSLNLSYEFDFWGKNRKKLEEALGLAVAEEMEKEEVKLTLSAAVAFSYLNWQAHTKEKKLYEKWLIAEEKLVGLDVLREEKGLDPLTISLQQKQQLTALQQKIEEKSLEQFLDLLFLKTLLGEDPDAPLTLTPQEEILTQKIALPDPLELNLMAQRPDLAAQIWRVLAAAKAVGVAKTEFYPNVNLTALAGLSSLGFQHLFLWASRTGTLNPAINIPIFTGGELTGNLGRKRALFEEAVKSYNQKLLEAAQEIASNISSFLSLQKQLTLQEELVALQTSVQELSSARYKKGIDPFSSALLSLEDLYSKKLQEVSLRHDLMLSTVKIFQSLGGGVKCAQAPTLPSSPP